mmetsp:Transcript_22036/g.36406  ORF Transcript_22036/g.36406 Transcript_22036/m.36406 type:complete len:80 (+) Transcript_22036:16-255(+)
MRCFTIIYDYFTIIDEHFTMPTKRADSRSLTVGWRYNDANNHATASLPKPTSALLMVHVSRHNRNKSGSCYVKVYPAVT